MISEQGLPAEHRFSTLVEANERQKRVTKNVLNQSSKGNALQRLLCWMRPTKIRKQILSYSILWVAKVVGLLFFL